MYLDDADHESLRVMTEPFGGTVGTFSASFMRKLARLPVDDVKEVNDIITLKFKKLSKLSGDSPIAAIQHPKPRQGVRPRRAKASPSHVEQKLPQDQDRPNEQEPAPGAAV